mmetsp:Transcript_31141/g.70374  ORF Transcript_31141/g.70374 Transcript_31141/m.70374 type:complete len:240 (-) Transcript_31141:61-780(-)
MYSRPPRTARCISAIHTTLNGGPRATYGSLPDAGAMGSRPPRAEYARTLESAGKSAGELWHDHRHRYRCHCRHQCWRWCHTVVGVLHRPRQGSSASSITSFRVHSGLQKGSLRELLQYLLLRLNRIYSGMHLRHGRQRSHHRGRGLHRSTKSWLFLQRCLDHFVHLEQLGQLHLLVCVIRYRHIGARECSVRLLRCTVGPHRLQVLDGISTRVVQRAYRRAARTAWSRTQSILTSSNLH